MTRFCEFTGDENKDWNEVPRTKRVCKWAGFRQCGLHKKPIEENWEGWRVCCEECTTPKQIKGE